MPYKEAVLAVAVLLSVTSPTAAATAGLSFDFYGSARVQVESVMPDNTSVLGSYTGIRDAYSRIGFNAAYPLTDAVELFGQLELPLDLANKAVQDPWDQDEDIRIGQIGLRGGFGTFAYGQMWMPYYNAIAYPVDTFSTYYSGFATFTSFRKGDTISFYSPGFNGLYFAAGWSDDNGADGDDRMQLTISYSLGETTIAAGLDDLGGEFDSRIWGVSLMHAMGNLYFGAKHEVHDSHIDSGYGADGDAATNIYVGYTRGKNTFKAMLAHVDNYGEDIVHLGVEHQYDPRLRFFLEYYQEEETAAITEKRGGLRETAWAAGGGRVWALGMRFDF